MGHLPEKSGEEYLQYLREETDVSVSGVSECVDDYLDPTSENALAQGDGRCFFPAMDLRTDAPFDGKMGTEDWQDYIAILVGQLDLVSPDLDDQYEGTGALNFTDVVRLEVYNQILGFKNAPQVRSHLLRSAGRELAVRSRTVDAAVRACTQSRNNPRLDDYALWERSDP